LCSIDIGVQSWKYLMHINWKGERIIQKHNRENQIHVLVVYIRSYDTNWRIGLRIQQIYFPRTVQWDIFSKNVERIRAHALKYYMREL